MWLTVPDDSREVSSTVAVTIAARIIKTGRNNNFIFAVDNKGVDVYNLSIWIKWIWDNCWSKFEFPNGCGKGCWTANIGKKQQ